MFTSLIRLWRTRDEPEPDVEASGHGDRRASIKRSPGHPKLQLNTHDIGPPIRRSPLAIDVHTSPASSTRSGPSSIAWLRQNNAQNEDQSPSRPPAARLGIMVRHTAPLSRSLSSPASSYSHPVMRLGMNPAHAGSTRSLRLDVQPHVSTLYGDAYDHPMVKPLSPIAEQDYFSPESLRRSIPLPQMSDKSSVSTSAPSPAGSRPSPVHSVPFITRPVNRSLSQSTHRSARSTTSTIAPSLSPLDIRPTFSAQDGEGTPLRTRRPSNPILPTIGNSEEYYNGNDPAESSEEAESPQAESFVTASESSPTGAVLAAQEEPALPAPPSPTAHNPIPLEFSETNVSMIRSDGDSLPPTRSPPSASESFIRRRWDKDSTYPSVAFKLKAKRQCFYHDATPAFWAFWLGIFLPVLWFVGGWHFTHFGEQPARLTFWEFYFNGAYWRELFCCGRGKLRWDNGDSTVGSNPVSLSTGKRDRKGKGKEREKPHASRHPPPLPRWITEKQSTDVKKARLNDAKRSLKGISNFGYPFVPRPLVHHSPSTTTRVARRIVAILATPNRFFDQFPCVKLKNVEGRQEGPRRMFDPWIQRCRYAFCYAMILMLAGLATAAACIIIFSLKRL
ncbi:hypothetical protein BDP27DRAFT_1420498 [Rhodocollybia butyracea]|uniref:Uncharacterized protein n=1 Tax=Rhodocollybia butyracea TaxID=206335 RepID=A0A9P5PPM9_9AGAR|nr:hypothetical protein BDP27DRAFT_1420498 [Rhodocollybia butyracea]